jgi:nucleoredoxin
LKDLYQKLKAREDVEDFELVFCSMDKTDAEYNSYTSDMPWYCLPHTSPVMGKLANQYGAQGIPHLVVLDKDGTVLQQDGVGEVSIDPEGTNFPWRPKPLVDLLPKEYLTTDNKRRPMSELDDKYLMLYMSAHWCPPCKTFSPKLSKAYTALKKSRDDFEVRCFCAFVLATVCSYCTLRSLSSRK